MAAGLEVYVIGARNLPGDWGEDIDPYVIVEYNGETKKTKVDKDAGKNPIWNKRFSFELANPPGKVSFKVYDQEVGIDEFKGQASIFLQEIMSAGSRVRNHYQLHGKKDNEYHGEIEVEIVIEYSAQYSEENAARLSTLEKQEGKHETNQMIAGVAGLAAAGIAAYAGKEAATGKGNQTTNSVIAGVAGVAALAAGGFAVSEHLKENKVEKQQEALGEKKHGWFD